MKIVYALSLFGLVVLLSGCNNLIDVKPADTPLTTDAVRDVANLEATIIAVYQAMETPDYYGRDFMLIPDVLADNGFVTRNESGRFGSYDANVVGAHINIYALAYKNINRLNLVLASLEAASGSAADKKRLKGEALFLRALHYFDLVRVYARPPKKLVDGFDSGVPLVLEPTINAAQLTYPARATVEAVYAQIEKDLTDVGNLLDNSLAPNRASKVAAQALASRVYLYAEKWPEAEASATAALASAARVSPQPIQFATADNYLQNWGNNYPEAIFQLTFQPGKGLESESLQAAYYIHPKYSGWGDISARKYFMGDQGTNLALYDTDDLRKGLYARTQKSGENVVYPVKFPGAKGYGADDIMVLRLSELYLNRAEARAQQNNGSGALADVGLIHNRAVSTKPLGTTLTASANKPALLTAIYRERNAELGFEGHRLFDLLRTTEAGGSFVKVNDAFYTQQTASNLTTVQLKNYKLVARMPAIELQANPNLKQNPGYQP